MTGKRMFVGREGELGEFQQALRSPQGQAILVVGQAGMGKSWLIEEMVGRAENGTLFQGEPGPKCWAVSYEIRPTDSVNRVVEQIVGDATEAARWVLQKLGLTGDKKDKWRALFAAAGIIPGFGRPLEKLGGLFLTFVKTPPRDTRDAFVTAMQKMSEYLSEGQRALFIVDPDKTMPVGSDHLWRSVVQELPDKIKLIFAQRPHDALVNNLEFCHLPNVMCLPRQAKQLHGLSEGAVEELTDRYARTTGQSGRTLRDAVRQYNGHAYSTVAALELLRRGMKPAELSKDPGGIAAAQWKEICKAGKEAIHLFKAHAILQVPVPEEVVTAVADLDADTYQSLVAHDYLGGLLRSEDESRAIYHAILGDHVLDQIDDNEKRTYHRRAAKTYAARLRAEAKPDSLSAEQLAGHVLEADNTAAFVETLVNTCTGPLISLGRLDTLIRLSETALQKIERDTLEEAAIIGNLGLVYRTRGNLDRAEQMFCRALEIDEKFASVKGMAKEYQSLGLIYQTRGNLDRAEQMFCRALKITEKADWLEGMAQVSGNLGLVYQTRGDLDQAERMHRQALEIDEKSSRLEGMAVHYGNLGLVYHARRALDQAEQMYRKALEIDEKLGQLEGVANQYGNLGLVYEVRGALDQAEQMYRNALEIDEKLGQLEGTGHCYANLGTIYKARGDFDRAREYWTKAVELYRKVGIPHMVEKVRGRLAELENKDKG